MASNARFWLPVMSIADVPTYLRRVTR